MRPCTQVRTFFGPVEEEGVLRLELERLLEWFDHVVQTEAVQNENPIKWRSRSAKKNRDL